jgi:hypothetical protein
LTPTTAVLIERRPSPNRVVARGAPHDELRNHRVVEHRNLEAAAPRRDRRECPDRPAPTARARARRRHESGVRILGVDAAFDRVGHGVQRALRRIVSRSPMAMRNCHCTRSTPVTISVTGCSTCRPRIHFEEIKLTVCVEQELNRAGVGVADRLRNLCRALGHATTRVRVEDRRRRLLHHFLMAPLNRTLALETNGTTVP